MGPSPISRVANLLFLGRGGVQGEVVHQPALVVRVQPMLGLQEAKPSIMAVLCPERSLHVVP